MTQHPAQGDDGLIGLMVRIPAGFVLAKAITSVDPFGQALRFRSIVRPAAAHLGRQVMGMGVKVALGAAVGLQLLQGTEPAVNGWMLSPQPVSLVVSQRGIHPFHVGNEDQIHGLRLRAPQPRSFLPVQLPFEAPGDVLKLLSGQNLLPRTQPW